MAARGPARRLPCASNAQDMYQYDRPIGHNLTRDAVFAFARDPFYCDDAQKACEIVLTSHLRHCFNDILQDAYHGQYRPLQKFRFEIEIAKRRMYLMHCFIK